LDDFIEKRTHQRVEVQWPITVFTDEGMIEGETINISAAGISFSCEEPLSLNETYRIFIMPIENQAIELKGRVVWSDVYGIDDENGTVCIGACFIEISDADQKVIEELAQKLSL
jgi:c-di-GMP-binding flagellar brake protein YcgR